jgi:hypothetical protein
VTGRAHVDGALDCSTGAGCARVGGGWGVELRGLRPAGAHGDVDLVLPALSFVRLDALDLEWIPAKRFEWKRAFVLDGAMVEVVLARRERQRWYSVIRGFRLEWPHDAFSELAPIRVVSAAALRAYRSSYSSFAA